jgi:hypothetical protein
VSVLFYCCGSCCWYSVYDFCRTRGAYRTLIDSAGPGTVEDGQFSEKKSGLYKYICLITAPVTLAALTPDYKALTNQGERNSFYIYRLYSLLK